MSSLRCDIRCKKCNRLLCKGCFQWLEIKCPRCGFLQGVRDDQAVDEVSEHQDDEKPTSDARKISTSL